MEPAEKLALWADRLRDMAILGLRFARSEADLERYRVIADAALELWSVATGRSPAQMEEARDTLFALPTPHTRAQAVVLEGESVWLTEDACGGWQLPTALYRLPDDTPALGVARMVAEQTGLVVEPTALTGVYDCLPRTHRQAYHAYDYVFAAQRIGGSPAQSARRFALAQLPELGAYQRRRLDHALAVLSHDAPAYFDFRGEVVS